MSTNKDYKKEWFAKANLDYFSPFITLWLACNSWYNFHYGLSTDRDHINQIKPDFTNSNKLYQAFNSKFNGADAKATTNLHNHLELLHYSLQRAEIKPQNLSQILSFMCLNIKHERDNSTYKNLIITDDIYTKEGDIKKQWQNKVIELGNVKLGNKEFDEKEQLIQDLFAGLIEIIYQVRCALVHGDLAPSQDNHEVVKYCYLVLYDLLASFCSNHLN